MGFGMRFLMIMRGDLMGTLRRSRGIMGFLMRVRVMRIVMRFGVRL
jgi:hypothetical protein